MDLSAIFAPLANWIEAHPAVLSWLMGWLSALCAGQTAKQMLPPAWSVTAAKRTVQVIATIAGTATAYVLWPPTTPHAIVYALVVGMSSPTAYTFIKAVIDWRWPELSHRLSWSRVQEREHECQVDPCLDPNCTKGVK